MQSERATLKMIMMKLTTTFRILTLVSVLLSSHRSTTCYGSLVLEQNEFNCDICGEGMEIRNPEGIVRVPNKPDNSCSYLQFVANTENWDKEQCDVLRPFVQESCRCSPINMEERILDEDSAMPSDAPSMVPTSLFVVQTSAPTKMVIHEKCFDDLEEIYELEKAIEDTTHRRKYILCPGKKFYMGYLESNGEISDGQPFLMLRPNVIYQCGEDGSRANDCILSGGDIALASYYGVYDGIYETVDNVVIQGLTFSSQQLFATILEAAGDIKFIDCLFKDQENVSPVLIQWNGDGPESASRRLQSTPSTSFQPFSKKHHVEMLDQTGEEKKQRNLENSLKTYHHVVTFQDCIFKDNTANKEIGFPGIIENSYGSELVVSNCLFENNEYGESKTAAPSGYAIRSFGPVDIDSTCFVDNNFLKDGPVLVYGASYTSVNNFATSSNDSLNCDFLALYLESNGLTDDVHPDCIASDVDTCRVDLPSTPAPTLSPTQAPVKASHHFLSSSAPIINRIHFLCTASVAIIIMRLV